jgi:fimbrial chaperone protein
MPRRSADRTFFRLLCIATCIAGAAPALASSFNISPIRVELASGRRTEALTIKNADEAPVVVQVHVVAWSQKDGVDQYDATREMLVTPPVLQLPANGEQIVRVALRGQPDRSQELAYRVVFEEVPQAAPAGFTGLRVALRLSVPIFIAPAAGKPHADLAWEMHALPGGEVEVAATNSGSAHSHVTDFEVQPSGTADAGPPALRGMTGKYVLPGSRVNWVLKAEPTPAAGTYIIHGHSDQGEFSAEVLASGS